MSTNVAAMGTMEIYRCPECNSDDVTAPYLDKKIKTPDQQRCVCNACGHRAKRWSFRKFQDIKITG